MRRIVTVCVLATQVVLSACYGFSGAGGLPKDLKTANIEPFDNQTAAPELQREVFEQLQKTLRDRLNLREATAAKADLSVRGTPVSYDVDISAGVSSDARQDLVLHGDAKCE